MRVRLTQIDGKLPLLALIKLAHYHRAKVTRCVSPGTSSAVARGLSSCAEYNKVSFDPTYENEPLATFEPMATPRAREALALPSRNLALTRAR